MKYPYFFTLMLLANMACQAQTKNQMTSKNNPLLCDPESGVCEIQNADAAEKSKTNAVEQKKPVKIVYFTDPICSTCWGIEPQLRKMKLEYGNEIEIEYRMGGLLPDWSYNSGGISKPSDVAHHWDEVSHYYNMPIDGDVWLEDPLHSSYPPSIAFKAAQIQDEHKAIAFLRKLREMVFLEKKNITKWENLSAAAWAVGLDAEKLKTDFETNAPALFKADLQLAREMGVRGFPTMFVNGEQQKSEKVYGFKPYATFEKAIADVYTKVKKGNYDKNLLAIFQIYPTLTLREAAEISEQTPEVVQAQLDDLTAKQKLAVYKTKNGNIWQLI
jgi:predicted DsbA family dithiol-disulfide isomerase